MDRNNDHACWIELQKRVTLTDEQLDLFKRYAALLIEWNAIHNLTALRTLEEIVYYHFLDSVLVTQWYPFNRCSMIADIGSGGGFPGLPLKILYPSIPVLLIEVIEKKCAFLKMAARQLGLEDVEVISLDWRTFLRKTTYELLMKNTGLFCARASLAPQELTRLFKPSSPYNKATLIYWASADWQPTGPEQTFLISTNSYSIEDKARKYVFFGKEGSL